MSDQQDKELNAELEPITDNGPLLTWNCHPMRRRPIVALAVSLFVVLCAVIIYVVSDGSRLFTVLTLVVLLMSLAKFYFPTKYAMNQHGIVIKTTTQKIEKPWSMFRSFYPDKNGVLLSPFAEPTRLENFRGMYILFDRNKEEVVAFVKNYVKKSNAGSEVKS